MINKGGGSREKVELRRGRAFLFRALVDGRVRVPQCQTQADRPPRCEMGA
jgi:hypothetical protein